MNRICCICLLKCFGISTEIEERLNSPKFSSPVPNSSGTISNTDSKFI